MKAMLAHFAIVGLACQSGSTGSAATSRSVEAGYATLSRADEQLVGHVPLQMRARLLGVLYGTLFGFVPAPSALDDASDRDLHTLYNAASRTEHYTGSVAGIRDMRLIMSALEHRGLASEDEVGRLHQALIGARQLTEADEVATQHPQLSLKRLPVLREEKDLVPGWPTELALDQNSHEFLRQRVDMRQPAQVIVIGSPFCHFSEDAVRDIAADSTLREAFLAHAKWLTTPESRFDWDVFQKWNLAHGGLEYTLMFKRDEWPMIDPEGTPTFYFFKNGVLQARVEGWPTGGRKLELVAALRHVGLLP
jgi:hypothetical protein